MKNRELKFRAWLKKEEYKGQTRMYYFDLFSFNSDDGSQWIDANPKENSFPSDILDYWKLADCELMQYTGLLDKNKKEIYQGDIVVSNENKDDFCIVRWNQGAVQYDLDTAFPGSLGSYYLDHNVATNNYEVVGNIYENSDLIK